jgi:hypothetical protein
VPILEAVEPDKAGSAQAESPAFPFGFREATHFGKCFDDSLTISFTAVKDNAKVSAIEIARIG